ncbi:uncharacterized protein LOC125591823 [Brassica napus]|uniref:uncharacterized protein LOC125591823 n=1 Tax=Brassica napus TaxID=3708 RepID=UPI00207AECBE|nr:uncharacterized protein LOC125591823 [Brassica napus]
MAENPSSKIPRDRLQRYMNYRLLKMAWGKTAYSILMRSVKTLSASSWTGDSYEVSGFALAINLWAMSSVNVLGKSLGKPCETSSSSDPLCLHWDSTRTPTITEVLEMEKINNVEVSTVIGLAEEYKHLVGATHSDDADFHKDIGQQRKTKDEDAKHGEDLNHSEDEEENKDEEEKTDEVEKKDEEYQKDKEQRKNKDHSMSNSEKLDKLIQMVRDLDKRVVVIQNVLGVKFNDGSPNKEDCENGASSGDRRSAQDYENEEDTIDEEANSGDKKSAPDDGNEEDTIAEEANSGDGRSAPDDENEEEICDEEAKSGTEHLRKEENILGKLRINQEILTAKWFSAIAVEEKYWVGVVVNLEKRSITTFNCAAMKFTYASLVPYINAYAMALPFMFRNFFKDVSMDTSKFSIKIVSEGFPQDGEVNEDASKKPVKVTKKCGRGNKDGEMNEDAYKKPVKVTKKRGRGNKVNISMYNGMKKGVTPPREVQQQVEDDAEVDAKDSENPETNGDGEMNNDASKKPVKVTKKRGRGNKGIVGPNFGQYHNGPRSKT